VRRVCVIVAILLSCLIIACIALRKYDQSSVIVWSSHVKITVYLKRNEKAPIHLTAVPLWTKEDFLTYQDDPAFWKKHNIVLDIDDFQGESFQVIIPTTGRSSRLWRELSYRQCRWLVLWVERDGFPRECVIVDLPADMRQNPSLIVQIPEKEGKGGIGRVP
jgi:hypothetical protein